MNGRAVVLDELAQGLRPPAQGLERFEGLTDEDQSVALRDLCRFCVQARATGDDALEGIRRPGLRPTRTPSVPVPRGRIDEQLGKVAGLTPRHERIKAFRSLVQILGLADARRRERFRADGCSHERHQPAPDRGRGVPA
ncbi:hypothetical protein SUDANB15_06422 [Streptomyces sp. enrichment culture]|uniref:DUF5958 family protein n=1 Tax=Streptomyces sp. enrichment culture TaxID=1795815 RepID=UPI003F57806D